MESAHVHAYGTRLLRQMSRIWLAEQFAGTSQPELHETLVRH